jgi:hypothetical protein
MKIWRVERIHWDYNQTSWDTPAVFSTEQAAQDYVERMEAHRGWPGESGPGSNYDWEVIEHEVWDEAPERVVLRHGTGRFPKSYRTEEYVPVGWEPTDPTETVVERDTSPAPASPS